MPKKKSDQVLTTSQRLGSMVKSCRDIMRKDKGLNGDLDRLPQLTWMMLLKFLDDLERQDQVEASLKDELYQPLIPEPYRWRDWAADEDGITGDELLAFINNDEATRPDGNRGPGLFTMLKGLEGEDGLDRRDVVSRVFSGTANRMLNGYLIRDVLNKLNGIRFTSSKELHTLSALYEGMLKEMRDAAGDSGEFYTPRPVIQLMVALVDPKLGETVLDPACGTGGFLVEAYEHIKKTVNTPEEREALQRGTLFGREAKSLPYLLGEMNMLLHGIDVPNIEYGNSLAVKLAELGDRERVDVVLTNPPFGGEEEVSIKTNFPADKQTAETALLFLQLNMRLLRRPGHPVGAEGGRAAVVVPNGTLYAGGVAARVREHLIKNFNLHTIVRLPKGVFEPYADIPTNILFFDASGPTKFIWYYEHPLPPERSSLKVPSYSQTVPLRFQEFQPLIAWWTRREESKSAWRVEIDSLEATGWNLDQKNPALGVSHDVDLGDVASALRDESSSLTKSLEVYHDALSGLADAVAELSTRSVSEHSLDEVCHIHKGKSATLKTAPGPYQLVVTAADRRTADSYQFDGEAVCIPTVSSTGHGHASINRLHYVSGKFALANIMAAVMVKPEVPLLSRYLYYYLWRHKDDKLVSLMAGTANTSLTITKLKTVVVTIPSMDEQRHVVQALDRLTASATKLEARIGDCALACVESFRAALSASLP